MGATNITLTDVVANRLSVARSLGAHHTLLIEKGRSESADAFNTVKYGLDWVMMVHCTSRNANNPIPIQRISSTCTGRNKALKKLIEYL